jgi:hypothetical protein
LKPATPGANVLVLAFEITSCLLKPLRWGLVAFFIQGQLYHQPASCGRVSVMAKRKDKMRSYHFDKFMKSREQLLQKRARKEEQAAEKKK